MGDNKRMGTVWVREWKEKDDDVIDDVMAMAIQFRTVGFRHSRYARNMV